MAIIDPSRPFPTDFNNAEQVSSWLTAVAGTGGFVKVWSPVRGAYESGISDIASTSDQLMLTALLNSLAAQGVFFGECAGIEIDRCSISAKAFLFPAGK